MKIGPWIGIFSCNARDAGFEVTALERDQHCVVPDSSYFVAGAVDKSEKGTSLGCGAVLSQAIDEPAKHFYEHFNFEASRGDVTPQLFL